MQRVDIETLFGGATLLGADLEVVHTKRWIIYYSNYASKNISKALLHMYCTTSTSAPDTTTITASLLIK